MAKAVVGVDELEEWLGGRLDALEAAVGALREAVAPKRYGIEPDQCYSVRDAARFLGLQPSTVYKHAGGTIPRHNNGTSRVVFLGKDLIAFLAQRNPRGGA